MRVSPLFKSAESSVDAKKNAGMLSLTVQEKIAIKSGCKRYITFYLTTVPTKNKLKDLLLVYVSAEPYPGGEQTLAAMLSGTFKLSEKNVGMLVADIENAIAGECTVTCHEPANLA